MWGCVWEGVYAAQQTSLNEIAAVTFTLIYVCMCVSVTAMINLEN